MDKKTLLEKIKSDLKFVYKNEYHDSFMTDLEVLLNKWEKETWKRCEPLTEKNVYLITYGDSIYEKGQPTLKTLHKFLKEKVGSCITDVHLLPMFEYSSDDGFSVIDYRKIDPNLGDWNNIVELSDDYRLMYDFVANHISQQSSWFKGFLAGEAKYKRYFIEEDKNFDSSKVIRPRTSPLFHKFKGADGEKSVWTTFSEDQIDLNARHFPLLLEMIDILLMYAHKGATSIRLDAIGFLWKESGSPSMHLPETHQIIKMWRLILDYFKKDTQIITETNVPHKDNISYFGNGNDEAHQVYQFSLPPLVLFSFTTHNSDKLTNWAKTIHKVSDNATFFNFLSSHDGIGMRPVEGILDKNDIQVLIDKVVANGGKVSYKNNTDGTQSVYELNINYQDALLNKDEDTTEELQVAKIIAAHSILLSVIGVPAIYYHSLLGSRNDYKGLEESKINRRINREKLEFDAITKSLNTDLRRKAIFETFKNIISIRQKEEAFFPYGEQKVLDLGKSLFALTRMTKKSELTFVVNLDKVSTNVKIEKGGKELVTGRTLSSEFTLKPYEFAWVKHI